MREKKSRGSSVQTLGPDLGVSVQLHRSLKITCALGGMLFRQALEPINLRIGSGPCLCFILKGIVDLCSSFSWGDLELSLL